MRTRANEGMAGWGKNIARDLNESRIRGDRQRCDDREFRSSSTLDTRESRSKSPAHESKAKSV
ncbi:hypothetical protein K438DRAFT_1872583 [Mycena galopus ATCC 62051]|nr:hypothetical protein K438DRAFT_1872583 [Mycena galopus ATCC 62051]